MNTLNTPKIESFVASACAGRDGSHGLEHAKRVRARALLINRQLGLPVSAFDVSLVSLLHDVSDYKFDHDGKLKEQVILFLKNHHMGSDKIMKTIEAISYSKEKKEGKRWFESYIGDHYWITVRDIVSDADKLEALGQEGGQRCLQYGAAHGNVGVKYLLQHMIDKLLCLRDEYIVTVPGKEMVGHLHDELVVFALKQVISEIGH